MSFQEIIACNYDGAEIMLHFNEEGKLLRMYCYADDIPDFRNYETGKDYKVKTVPCFNALFVNLENALFSRIKNLLHFFLEEDKSCPYYAAAARRYNLNQPLL